MEHYLHNRYSAAVILILLLGLVVLGAYVVQKQQTPIATTSAPPTANQATDQTIGQQPESANAPLTSPSAPASTLSAAVALAPLAPGCSLHFSFAPTGKTVAPGGELQYAIVLSNLGQAACTNASFSIYYADNEIFVSSSLKSTAGNYYWRVGNLVSRGTYQLGVTTVETLSSMESQLQNEACATADNGSDVCADNLVFINPGAAAMPAVGLTQPAVAQAPVAAPTVAPASGSTVWGAAFASRQFGTWIWDSPLQMTSSYMQSALAAAAKNGFNTIYLTIDDYLPISQLPAGAVQAKQQAAYFAALAAFIQQAQAAHISVFVEGGANDWGDATNRWKGQALVAFIKAYDAAYPKAPVAGLQLDVESYLEPRYAANQSDVLLGYLNLISEVTTAMASMPAQLSIVVPHFYDDQIQWTPALTFQGQTTYTYNHLLHILQQKPGSSMVVMAYRNTVTGSNGTEALAQTEIAEANGTATKVIVAQETGNVQPSYVTFYGLSKSRLYSALAAITSDLSSDSSFGGVAVHYLDPFLELR